MKKFVRKLAILWMAIVSIIGFTKSRAAKPVSDLNEKIARQRLILLDEFELSAFHNS